ncbi:MAG: hypothetical protein M1824_004172 [Vezdaea acicularis]|nr:MAG: hypothetical protein M1824_004172 [Vezdaea acicularis]
MSPVRFSQKGLVCTMLGKIESNIEQTFSRGRRQRRTKSREGRQQLFFHYYQQKMDMPVNVPVDDPNADTEWNDILRKHGVIPEKPPSPTPMIEEALAQAQQLAHENRLEGKNLEELDELEDDEDEAFLEKYRKQRMQELSTLQSASVFNQVYPIQKPDYARDVTEASKAAFVLVHLTSSHGANTESRVLSELWREAARKYGDIKFCEIRGDMCIEGYPDKNCPTILVYHDEEIVKQLVTLQELNGRQTKIHDVEQLLVSIGALSPRDRRLVRESASPRDATNTAIRARATIGEAASDDGDDWD